MYDWSKLSVRMVSKELWGLKTVAHDEWRNSNMLRNSSEVLILSVLLFLFPN